MVSLTTFSVTSVFLCVTVLWWANIEEDEECPECFWAFGIVCAMGKIPINYFILFVYVYIILATYHVLFTL